jgi:hypothetical protein
MIRSCLLCPLSSVTSIMEQRMAVRSYAARSQRTYGPPPPPAASRDGRRRRAPVEEPPPRLHPQEYLVFCPPGLEEVGTRASSGSSQQQPPRYQLLWQQQHSSVPHHGCYPVSRVLKSQQQCPWTPTLACPRHPAAYMLCSDLALPPLTPPPWLGPVQTPLSASPPPPPPFPPPTPPSVLPPSGGSS